MSARYQSLALKAALFGAFAWVDRHGRRGRHRRPALLERSCRQRRAVGRSDDAATTQRDGIDRPDGAERGLRGSAPRGLPRRSRKRPTRVAPDLRGVGACACGAGVGGRPPGQRGSGSRGAGGRARPADRRRRTTPACSGAVAAAMALVKAYRMHGHLAARLDPLGSEPMGDPALDETRLVPALTPELQARIPASLLRLYVPGETLPGRPAAAPRGVHGLERLRDRAHLGPRRARLAAQGDRVRPLPRPARARAPGTPPAAPRPGRGGRAVSPEVVPRPEAVLARGARRAHPDAGRDDRAGRRGRRSPGRHRDGAPRAARTRSSTPSDAPTSRS